jgi:hypothetical protein
MPHFLDHLADVRSVISVYAMSLEGESLRPIAVKGITSYAGYGVIAPALRAEYKAAIKGAKANAVAALTYFGAPQHDEYVRIATRYAVAALRIQKLMIKYTVSHGR